MPLVSVFSEPLTATLNIYHKDITLKVPSVVLAPAQYLRLNFFFHGTRFLFSRFRNTVYRYLLELPPRGISPPGSLYLHKRQHEHKKIRVHASSEIYRMANKKK
jgi:hypothetical protein